MKKIYLIAILFITCIFIAEAKALPQKTCYLPARVATAIYVNSDDPEIKVLNGTRGIAYYTTGAFSGFIYNYHVKKRVFVGSIIKAPVSCKAL